MQIWTRAAAALGAAAALAAATACAAESGEASDDEAVPDGDRARLVEMLNENMRLDSELRRAEDRVIAECIEARGLTVHDKRYLGQYEVHEYETLVDGYTSPIREFLPEVDEAAKWGFGWWLDVDYESTEAEEYLDEYHGLDRYDDEPAFDNSEFESLPDDERRAWSVAYQGEEATADLEGTVEPPTEGEDGGLEFEGGDEIVGTEPGGCQREMIDALYGEPRLVDVEWGGDTFSRWSWRAEAPSIDDAAIEGAFAERTAAAGEDFLACVAERGRGEWRFAEDGRLYTASYGLRFYLDGRSGVDEPYAPEGEIEIPEAPELPDDIPADFDDKQAYEADIAVDFAECGDQTGYRRAATEAWEAAHAEQHSEIETETFAWQEQMRADIERARELIES